MSEVLRNTCPVCGGPTRLDPKKHEQHCPSCHRIAELEAQLSERQWVPVSTSQPDCYEFLAFDGDDIFMAQMLSDDLADHYEGVTHWMPLPAAPGQEGEE